MKSKLLSSKKGTLLGEVFSDDSDCDENTENVQLSNRTGSDKSSQDRSSNGASKSGKRRSSFGGARFKNEEEQTRIVDMYTNIIKLSSENKINEKNSWGLDLIEHMGKLIKADSSKQRGVNFQKASCTLDASVKIYANRVDDTYSHSHRVLESFSRTDGHKGNNSDDEEDTTGKPRRAARVGANKASSRLNIGDTIEKNLDNINAKEAEHDVQLDPMFHTISKLFDKGGTEGMLMHNLRCNPFSAAMALNQEGLPDPFTGLTDSEAFESVSTEETPLVVPVPISTSSSSSLAPSSPPTAEMIDITDMVNASKIYIQDLEASSICPQLNIYRSQVHNKGKDSDVDILDTLPTSGSSYMGVLNVADFKGSHFTASAAQDMFQLQPSVHSLTRDLKTIPFADMTDAMKAHTFANPKHAYYDVMCCVTENSADSDKALDLFAPESAADYDISDAIAEHDDENGVSSGGVDDDDCDEDGNYIQSQRRASCIGDKAGSTDSATVVDVANEGNTRQSMLRAADINNHGGEDDNDDCGDNLGGIQWDAVNGNADVTEAELLAVPTSSTLVEVEDIINASNKNVIESEYAFFDVNSLAGTSSSNEWVGAKHWKRAPSSRLAAQVAKKTESTCQSEEEIMDNESAALDEEPKKSKTKSKKAGVELNLAETQVYTPESAFKLPTGRGGSNTTLMTQAALNKQKEAADEEELLLPLDSKLKPKDLCRLFTAPSVVVPPSVLTHLIKQQRAAALGVSSQDSDEVLWGERKALSAEERLVAGNLDIMDDDVENDEVCDYDDDAYFLQQKQEQQSTSSSSSSSSSDGAEDDTEKAIEEMKNAMSGLEIDESKLVQVDRKVEKIDIGYSKVAKKINVKMLKTDIWREISDLHGGSERSDSANKNEVGNSTGDDENAPPAADFHATETSASIVTDKSSYCDGTQMSFQGLVNDLAIRQKQKDVSVSFYFICLLHLANEKTLKLEDNEFMSDLIVTKDT